MLSSALAAILSARPIVDALSARLRQPDSMAGDSGSVAAGLQRLLTAAQRVERETQQLLAQGAGLNLNLANGH